MQAIALLAFALALSTEQQEDFLRTAKVIASREAGAGVTESHRVTLSDGIMRHDAHVQTVDIYKNEVTISQRTQLCFRDSWKYNIAAYRLSKMVGLDMIPASVERRVLGGSASVTWWLDDVLMDESARQKNHVEPARPLDWTRQFQTVYIFDELIYNTDRNSGNLLITKDWKLWMIDHSRGFRLLTNLPRPARIQGCDRTMLERMRALDEASLARELRPYLTRMEIRAILARRDVIVGILDEKRQRKGDEAVLFELTPQALEAAVR